MIFACEIICFLVVGQSLNKKLDELNKSKEKEEPKSEEKSKKQGFFKNLFK